MILVKVSTACLLVKLTKLHTIAISVSTICLLVEELHIITILVSTTCLLVKLKKPHTIAISVSTSCLLVEELHIIATLVMVPTTCLLCLRYVGPSKQLGVNQLFACGRAPYYRNIGNGTNHLFAMFEICGSKQTIGCQPVVCLWKSSILSQHW